MAIRPVDLQLAYMAAPQSAAVLNSSKESPAAAQQATAAAFAAEVVRREEQVEQPDHTQGTKVRPRDAREKAQDHRPGRKRKYLPNPQAEGEGAPIASDGEEHHFIDVTA